MIQVLESVAIVLAVLSPVLASLWKLLKQVNVLENEARDLMRTVKKELTPNDEFKLVQQNIKVKIALLQYRVNDIEGYLQVNTSFTPTEINENSFL